MGDYDIIVLIACIVLIRAVPCLLSSELFCNDFWCPWLVALPFLSGRTAVRIYLPFIQFVRKAFPPNWLLLRLRMLMHCCRTDSIRCQPVNFGVIQLRGLPPGSALHWEGPVGFCAQLMFEGCCMFLKCYMTKRVGAADGHIHTHTYKDIDAFIFLMGKAECWVHCAMYILCSCMCHYCESLKKPTVCGKKKFEKAGLQLHCSIAHARLLQYIQCTIVTHAVHNVG